MVCRWFAGDKGDARTVELTFDPSATTEQRAAIRVFLSQFPAPASFEFKGTSGWTIAIDMNSTDVIAAR
jgi:hypothetical protein